MEFMKKAVELSIDNVLQNRGGPFGAVIVKNGVIIGKGQNRVVSGNDPTAHAEIEAIRDACRHLNDFNLQDAELYTSCEPCPMCYSAIRWARINHIYYSNTRKDAHDIGFSDKSIYDEIENKNLVSKRLFEKESLRAFQLWDSDSKKTNY